MKKAAIALLLISVLLLSACSSKTQGKNEGGVTSGNQSVSETQSAADNKESTLPTVTEQGEGSGVTFEATPPQGGSVTPGSGNSDGSPSKDKQNDSKDGESAEKEDKKNENNKKDKDKKNNKDKDGKDDGKDGGKKESDTPGGESGSFEMPAIPIN